MLLPFDPRQFHDDVVELDAWYERLAARQTWAERGWPQRLRRELEAEAIAHSTRIEGVPVTVDQVRRILGGDPPAEVAASDRDLVEGYRDAVVLAQRRADDPGFVWHRAELIALQGSAMRGTPVAGALRGGEVYIARGSEVVFTPPPATQVPALLDAACERAEALGAGAHPALAAAWIHVAVAAIHPFADGNGRTARLCTTLAMCRGGRPAPFASSLEEWWGNHTTDYYAAFGCLGSRFDDDADVTPFVAAHLRAQLAQARALDLREAAERRLWRLCAVLAESHSLPERAGNALWEAFFGREVSARYYGEVCDVSPATARNDLAALVAAGAFEASGRTRGRTYLPTGMAVGAIAERLDVDPGEDETAALRHRALAALADRVRAEASPAPGPPEGRGRISSRR
ncbi:MAG: Fic family protein [Solirubrobacterales bacterium]